MRSTALILAIFAALVVACPPLPYKRRRSVSNDSLLKDLDTLIDYNPAAGWVHKVGTGSKTQPWPRGTDGIVRITYCFKNQESKDELAGHIEKALHKWSRALGKPSKQTGHALAKPVEFVKDGKPMLCRKGNEWDPNVPDDTLEIIVIDEEIPGAATTPGYWPVNPSYPSEGRHYATFGMKGYEEDSDDDDDYEDVTAGDAMENTFVHEMGHVFGLQHEHQRSDRDLFVKFRCEALADYQIVKKEVEAKGQHKMEEVCESYDLANLYEFSAAEFSIKFDDNTHGFIRTSSATYDVHSVMSYHSWTGSDIYGDGMTIDFDEWPMVQWNDVYNLHDKLPPKQATRENSAEITIKKYPSYLDIKALTEIYFWDDS